MRKLAAAVAGSVVALFTSSSAQAQAKPAAVPTLSAGSMVVFGAVLGVAALLVQRRKR